MYLSASDIKLKNLGDKDVETGNELVECARALMLSEDLPQAQSKIELAVRVIRAAPNSDIDSLKMALQTHADILNQAGHPQMADPIYAELRRLP